MTFKLIQAIKEHEGYRKFPYHCTANKLTIGYGFNLEDVGISEEESELILKLRLQKLHNKLNELDSILKFTFIISNIIFFLWAFERWDGSAFQGFISLVAIFLLIYFDLKFMSDSKNYKTENFIIWIIESKLIIVAILISILVLVITF